MIVNDNKISFLHFGCWNDKCNISDEDVSFDSHSGNINFAFSRNFINKLDTTNIDFAIIAGDNIYPDKRVSIDINRSIIQNGDNCLGQLDIKKYFAIGNHDLDSCEYLLDELNTYGRGINKLPNKGSNIFPHTYYSEEITKNGKIEMVLIFIDTSLLAKQDKCYELLDNRYSGFLDILYNHHIGWLWNTLNKYKNYTTVVIGHAPFFYLSHKGEPKKDNPDKSSPILLVNPDLIKVYQFFKLFGVKLYLCADEHNIQHFYDKTCKIHHIICSAGAKGDVCINYIKYLVNKQNQRGGNEKIDAIDIIKNRLQAFITNNQNKTYNDELISAFFEDNSSINFVITINNDKYNFEILKVALTHGIIKIKYSDDNKFSFEYFIEDNINKTLTNINTIDANNNHYITMNDGSLFIKKFDFNEIIKSLKQSGGDCKITNINYKTTLKELKQLYNTIKSKLS